MQRLAGRVSSGVATDAWVDLRDNDPLHGLAVLELTEDDAEDDLQLAFCPTGEGGGVDPTCSPAVARDMDKAKREEKRREEKRERKLKQRKLDNVPETIPPLENNVLTNKSTPLGYVRYLAEGWAERLSDEHSDIINDFTDAEYSDLREAEAAGKDSDRVRLLNEALDTAPVFEGIVYRGLSLDENDYYSQEYYDELGEAISEPGNIIELQATSSASRDPETAHTFAGISHPYVLRILSLTGRAIEKASAVEEEKEVALRTGSRYRVLRATRNVQMQGTSGGKKLTVIDMVELEDDELRESRGQGAVRLAFCPTGPGGGVDPTCSPNAGWKNAKEAGIDPNTWFYRGMSWKEYKELSNSQTLSLPRHHGNQLTTDRETGRYYAREKNTDDDDGVVAKFRVRDISALEQDQVSKDDFRVTGDVHIETLDYFHPDAVLHDEEESEDEDLDEEFTTINWNTISRRSGQAYWNRYAEKLTPEYRRAVRDYTDEGYEEVRRAEVSGKPDADAFNAALDLAPEQYTGVTYRGFKMGGLEDDMESLAREAQDKYSSKEDRDEAKAELQRLRDLRDSILSEGTVIKLEASASSSRDPRQAVRFAGMREGAGVLFRFLKNRTGVDVSHLSRRPGELEVVRRRGAVYRVTSVHDDVDVPESIADVGSVTVVDLEELSPSERHDIELAFDPSQPRDERGRWTDTGAGLLTRDAKSRASEFPKTAKGLHVEKMLGGSTGAKLVKDPATGKRYVLKHGKNQGHLKNEFYADEVYRAMGVPVPNSKLVDDGSGSGTFVKLSEYVEGKTLGDLPDVSQKIVEERLQKNFVADALLGNWDVIGLDRDNILVEDGTYNEKVLRVDTGGSMSYRAQGALKTGSQWGPVVQEIASMRSATVNPQAAEVFKDVTPDMIRAQVDAILEKVPAIMTAAYGSGESEMLLKRLDYLQKNWSTKAKELAKQQETVKESLAQAEEGMKKAGLTVEKVQSKPLTQEEILQHNKNIDEIKAKQQSAKPLTQEEILQHNKNIDEIKAKAAPITGIKVAQDAKLSLHKNHIKAITEMNKVSGDPKTLYVPYVIKYKDKADFDKIVAAFPGKKVVTVNPAKFLKQQAAKPQQPATAKWHAPQVIAQPQPSKEKIQQAIKLSDKTSIVQSEKDIVKHFGPAGTYAGGETKRQNSKAELDAWWDALSSAERNAVTSFKGSSSGIRKAENGVKDPGESPQMIAKAEALNSALDKAPVFGGALVGRGVNPHGSKESEKWLTAAMSALRDATGKYVSFEATASSSRNVGSSPNWASHWLVMRLLSKTGVDVTDYGGHEHEKEVMQRRGSFWRVLRVQENVPHQGTKIKMVVDMEEVSPIGKPKPALYLAFDPDQPRDEHGRWTGAKGDARFLSSVKDKKYERVIAAAQEANPEFFDKLPIGQAPSVKLLSTLPSRTVNVRDIVSTQSDDYADESIVNRYARAYSRLKSFKREPYGVLHEGKVYVLDGHHRILGAMHAGAKTVKIRVVDTGK